MKLKTIESTLPWSSSPRWSKKAFFTLLHLRLSVLVPFSSPPPMQKVNLAHRVKLLSVDPPSLSALLGKGGTCEAYHDPKNHFAHFAYGCRTCIKRKWIHHCIFFIFVHKNINFPKDLNWPIKGFWVRSPFLTFPHEKTTFQWWKWFLRQYVLLIRVMFVFRSGLRFSFRALKPITKLFRSSCLWRDQPGRCFENFQWVGHQS